MRRSKCSFVQKQIEYLGHMVSVQGVEPVPAKILAIQQWLTQQSAWTLRNFLGFAGFYCRFILGYSSIARPLTRLVSQDTFTWTPVTRLSFNELKQALNTAPIMQLPDFTLPFTVETDASGVDMGAVLSQKNHPIAFSVSHLHPDSIVPPRMCASFSPLPL